MYSSPSGDIDGSGGVGSTTRQFNVGVACLIPSSDDVDKELEKVPGTFHDNEFIMHQLILQHNNHIEAMNHVHDMFVPLS